MQPHVLIEAGEISLKKISNIFSNAAFQTEPGENYVYIKGSSIEFP